MDQFKDILFIDIETVPLAKTFDEISEGLKDQWRKKSRFVKSSIIENATPDAVFEEKAGIFSEFAKVVCIGLGCYIKQENEWKFVLKSIVNDDEKVLLNNFCEAVERFSERTKAIRFCGHNIKEFDLPFLCRRMIINGLGLPQCLQMSGKKPWEITHVDTLDLWRFGDYKHYTSLALLAEVLGIPSPKDDIDGSMVGAVYWNDGDLPRIAKYCLQDVLTTAKVFLRLNGVATEHPEVMFI